MFILYDHKRSVGFFLFIYCFSFRGFSFQFICHFLQKVFITIIIFDNTDRNCVICFFLSFKTLIKNYFIPHFMNLNTCVKNYQTEKRQNTFTFTLRPQINKNI